MQTYYDQGHGFVECSRRFGFTHTAWTKAIKRGRLRASATRFADRRRRYDWAEVQAYYDAGHRYREAVAQFGFCSGACYKAIERGEIKPHAIGMPITELFSEPKRNRSHLKRQLPRANLLENRCQGCGLDNWLGHSINMHLDHINGITNDNRLENLRMLCPNCHSQTPTYGGRNSKRRRLQEPATVV